jgi:hypothetical protein
MSIDSTLMIQHPMYYEIIQVAARKWNTMIPDVKDAWKKRVTVLYSCPRMDGTFQNVPTSIMNSSITDNVIQSLTQDLVNFM